MTSIESHVIIHIGSACPQIAGQCVCVFRTFLKRIHFFANEEKCLVAFISFDYLGVATEALSLSTIKLSDV